MLLLIVVTHETAWRFFPAGMQADIWNITGALARAFVVFGLGLLARSWLVWAVVALGIGFDLQTAWCSSLYIIAPWEVRPGQDLCSSRYEIPFGLVFSWAALLIVHFVRRALRDKSTA